MFAFSRHNYYVQKKLRSTRTPEEQHASSDRGNTDVRQYFYDVYRKSAPIGREALCITRPHEGIRARAKTK